MSAKHTPAITKTEFDAIEQQLREALERWWADEKADLEADPPPEDPSTDQLWEGMPEIDSKSVVKASPVIRELIGAELDPKLIRKGGYTSFDDLANDLLPKLRAACPDTHPPEAVEPLTEGVAR
jgi:hypothetical protein